MTFHFITDMNCKQGGKVLDLNEQVDLNPSSNSLMVSKVTQYQLLYTPIHVSFFNEYDCVLEFPTEFGIM